MKTSMTNSGFRRVLVVVVALLAASISSGTAAAKQSKNHPAKYSTATILVKFERGANVNPEAEARAQGNEVIAKVGVEQVRLIKIKPGQSVEVQLAKYRARKDVVYAELNYVADGSLGAPSDPGMSAQWGLNRIHAVEGWTIWPGAYGLTGGPKIAVVDTGVQANHPDLGNVDSSSGANCVNFVDTCSAWVGPAYDDEGHGTHVAGIAAAVTNNATGGAGVAISSPVMPVKVLGADGSGTYAAVTNGIAWAENHGAKVINLSLGAPAYSSTLCGEVAHALSRGILVVAAAGNETSSTPFYPAACSGVVGVGATDAYDYPAYFSNYGYPNVFISAPGVNIYSTYPTSTYAYLQGTSMASPFVAGLAALLFGQVPSRSPAEVKRILAATADKPNVGSPYVYGSDRFNACGGSCTWHPQYGYGVINAQQALLGPAPHITSFTPAAAPVGAQVTLTGTDLGTASAVTFGSVPALFTVLSSTSIRATVPPSATTGLISVTTLAGTRSSATQFKVLPKITGLLPAIGREGDAVTVQGTTFDGATSLKFGAVSAPIESNDGSSIQTHVPAGALTGAVTVVTPGGTSIGPAFKVLPTIDEPFSPDHGFTGTVVTLTGKTFTGTTSVKVGGVAAPFSLLAGALKVTVPAAAVSGPISVTNAGGTSTTSGSFTVDPKITAFTPLSAPVGATVTLTGSGFGASGETRTIEVNGIAAASFSALASGHPTGVVTAASTWVSPTSVKFTVPVGATTGTIRITVGSAVPFTTSATLKVLPKVVGYSPAAAREGDAVTVNGTTLDGATSLKFGTLSAPIESNDGSSIQTHVPVGALTGAVTVVTPGGTSIGPAFKVLPTIDEPFSPDHGFTGTVVTLTGKTFTGTTSVKVGGVAAPFSLLAGALKVTVPAAAVSGPISVSNAGGTSTTSGSFTVDPKITSFTPLSAPVGAAVTLSGSGFGASGETRAIELNGLAASSSSGVRSQSLSWVSPTSVKFTVPAGATTGTIRITVGSAAPFTTAASFKVLPKVVGYSPPAARAGDAVTVNGTTLDGATSLKFGTLSAPIESNDGTSIQTHVPLAALSGPVTVVTPGGTSIGPAFKVLPTIDEPFSPDHGFTGTVVTLTGKTFTGTTSVKVGGVAAPFSLLAGALKVTVPAAAVSGPISVTNAGGTSTTSGPFTVDPKITSFTPLSAPVGATVTLSGSGFGASGETRAIELNGLAASSSSGVRSQLVSWVSPTSVKFTVPAGATTGTIRITVGSAAPFTTAATLKVLPKVVGYSPAAAREGDPVTVNGTTLDGATSVKFGALSAPIESNDGTSIQTHVPVGALTGVVTVVTPGGTSIGPAFKVLPTIDEPFSPDHGFTGTVVTLTGKTFTGTSSVKIGGVAAPFSLLAGALKVTVPAAAVSGPISVTNAGGTSTTSGSFTVDPKITSFTPLSAPVGATVTLTGSGFGASGETRTITVNGVSAASTRQVVSAATTWLSPTSVRFTVPSGASTGTIQITVGSAAPFTTTTTLKVPPNVVSYSPAAAKEGEAVTIQGSSLDGATSLKFGAISAPIESNDGSAIQTHVPVGALTGTVTVATPGGTAVGPAFKVLPTIDEPFNPDHGFTGTVVTLTGKSFTGTTSVKVGGVAATFTLVSGSLNVTVPAAAVSGPISVTNAGGTTTTAGSFTVDPKITSFTPTSGMAGTTITVAGSGFGDADRVDFGGGTSAVPSTVTATSLQAVVPAGTSSGTIKVHTPAGDSAPSSMPFTITFSVTGNSPSFGGYNEDVTVTGEGLTGVTAVKFNGIDGTIQPGGTATALHVHAPSSGNITGHVTVWKGTSSLQAPSDFLLLTVTSFSPTSGWPGTDVVISGHGFTGATSVKFNGTAATTFTVDNDGQITAKVPTGATDGTIAVTVPAGTATSVGSFTVTTPPVPPASLQINEVNANMTGAQDLVELKALVGGSISGLKLYANSTLLATLPDVSVAAGDIIVLHLNNNTIASETASKTDCTNAVCYADAWDIFGNTIGITYSANVLIVKDSGGSIQDAAAFKDPAAAASPAAFLTALGSVQSAGAWLPADCGGSACTDATTPTAQGISVDWTGLGGTATGSSAQRVGDADSDQASDWTVAAGSFGTANAP